MCRDPQGQVVCKAQPDTLRSCRRRAKEQLRGTGFYNVGKAFKHLSLVSYQSLRFPPNITSYKHKSHSRYFHLSVAIHKDIVEAFGKL